LSLGIFDLEDFLVLERVPVTLTDLFLGPTRSTKPSLQPLARFQGLRILGLDGQSNGIEAVGQLPALEDLTLQSVSTPNLFYLLPLQALRALHIRLGELPSFAGIEDKQCLSSLELGQMPGLKEIEVVGRLPGLQLLVLQSLPQLTSLPDLSACRALRRMVLQDLKGLWDFRALQEAPALEEFALVDGARQLPEQLLPVLRNPKVRRVRGMFGSKQKNEAFTRLAAEHKKSDWNPYEPFEFC
jgi:hypothetical protein